MDCNVNVYGLLPCGQYTQLSAALKSTCQICKCVAVSYKLPHDNVSSISHLKVLSEVMVMMETTDFIVGRSSSFLRNKKPALYF